MYISQQNVYITILPQQALRAVRRQGVHVGDREREALGPGGTLYQCSVGPRLRPLHPEPADPGSPNSALSGRKASSRKFGARLMKARKNEPFADRSRAMFRGCVGLPGDRGRSAAASIGRAVRDLEEARCRFMLSSCEDQLSPAARGWSCSW
jgi:hypothetical protein